MTTTTEALSESLHRDLVLPRSLRAPQPGWTVQADVVVIGSGIAGLTAALGARSLGRVLLVTKTSLQAGATVWAQGGIAAALHPEDSPAAHEADTLTAGAGLCDVPAVRTLVEEGPARVHELSELGARFEQDRNGDMALTREGGHRRDRIAHAGGDATGREISRALVEAVRSVQQDPGIQIIENAMVLDLLTSADGRACGATLHVLGSGSCDGVGAVRARAVVLATGGFGQVYASTTNPPVSTGDGLAAALRAGAEVVDLEFVQFHPTVLWLGRDAVGQQPLISEAVRGEGALLRDTDGVPVMQGQHPLGDLAPRDIVAQQVLKAMRRTCSDHVFLDARHLGEPFLLERFPSIMRRCRSLGLDPASDLLPVAPAQHYASGGVRTDVDGRTCIPALFACGEVSGTGVHGANRLASNSLLEGLVWGRRLVETMKRDGLPEWAEPMDRSRTEGLVDVGLRGRIQEGMTAGAGPVRDADGLSQAQSVLAAVSVDAPAEQAAAETWETTNLHAVGLLLVAMALRRTESRGGHWRLDHRERDDARWRVRQVGRLLDDGSVSIREAAVRTG